MTVDDGLKLAVNHLRDTLDPLDVLWLRPGWNNISHSSLHMRWDFPTGGGISLSFSFDIKHEGAGAQMKMRPVSQVTASIGSHLEEAAIFVEVLARVHAAAQRALLLMRTQTYEV